MSDAGGPHGQSLGLVKCYSKSLATEEGKLMVSLSGANLSVSATLSKEAADYLVVGESYELKLTTP